MRRDTSLKRSTADKPGDGSTVYALWYFNEYLNNIGPGRNKVPLAGQIKQRPGY
jgi:hypothetical protein